MHLDYRTADREAQPHAVRLGGNEWFEQPGGDVVGKARPTVGDGDLHHAFITQRRRHVELAPSACLHRLDGIAHEIDEHLLDLDAVDENVPGVGLEMQPHLHAERPRPLQGQRTSLLDHRRHPLHPLLCFAAAYEFAQAPHDLPGAQDLLAGLTHHLRCRDDRLRRPSPVNAAPQPRN